jgi:hypothetical protein
MKNFGQDSSDPVEIRTKHLPNTRQARYRYCSHFDWKHLFCCAHSSSTARSYYFSQAECFVSSFVSISVGLLPLLSSSRGWRAIYNSSFTCRISLFWIPVRQVPGATQTVKRLRSVISKLAKFYSNETNNEFHAETYLVPPKLTISLSCRQHIPTKV